MNNKRSWKDYKGAGIMALLVLTAAIIIFFAVYRADSIGGFFKALLSAAAPIIFGIVIAYLLNPIVMGFEKMFLKKMQDPYSDKTKGKARALAIAVSIILMLAVIIFLLYLVLPTLIETVTKLVKELPEQIKNVTNWLDERAADQDSAMANFSHFLKDMVVKVDDWLKTVFLTNAQDLRDAVTSGVMSVLSTLFNIFIGIIVSCYLLANKEKYVGMVKKITYATFSKKRANNVMKVMKKSNGVFGGFISGKIVDSLLLGFLCFIFMFITRMDYAVFISVLVGICNLIPFFGQWISMLAGGALLLLQSPVQGIVFMIFIVILQQVD
ncbi:MAG: AI-2E family transporter, partial [Lachnospiraceae bacterium]|nr:AI-2E family transporter [Lachnospiraceae bacterium]